MTTATLPKHYTDLCALMRTKGTLGSVAALVGWDQETYMPAGGAQARGEQSALLARLVHQHATDQKVGELIVKCEVDSELNNPESEHGANIREMRRDYDKATKLPSDLVANLAQAQSEAQDVWKSARANNDFESFVPALTKVMDLTKEKASCLKTDEHEELYDALLGEYEPGAKATEIAAVFEPLRDRLSAFIAELRDNGTAPRVDFLSREIPVEKQHAFGQEVTAAFGFDYSKGRLDTTTHPFCSGFGPGDTRMTTRYSLTNFPDAIGSTMHECGHGLYEQGIPKDGPFWGTPMTDSISLGIHESQSRMWENMVGRSKAFWTWALPLANKHFDGAFDDIDVETFTKAMNTATPSFIRVESDESTYNLHVMLRFELERAMLRNELAIKDLPEAWNAKFKDFLGLDVPNDATGCLQDVHWSFGLVGYFPTYSLGNLNAAQMWETINEQIPELNDQIARGEFGALLNWTREHIHQHGRRYTASEVIERATGKPLESDPLMRHLESRVRPAYGL
ncbi:MAG: carboxypeptidase M32 [Phycisphaerales bacterium]|nr:carboxypeptidase M32 [Phycisphaerales bacterium]